jgi:hypothetical protein
MLNIESSAGNSKFSLNVVKVKGNVLEGMIFVLDDPREKTYWCVVPFVWFLTTFPKSSTHIGSLDTLPNRLVCWRSKTLKLGYCDPLDLFHYLFYLFVFNSKIISVLKYHVFLNVVGHRFHHLIFEPYAI